MTKQQMHNQNLASCALSCSLLHVNFTTINSFFKNFIYIEGYRTGKSRARKYNRGYQGMERGRKEELFNVYRVSV